jgi:tetraacyldisaccharide 4'-kinase
MIPEHRPTRLPVFLASALSKLYSIGINHQNQKFDRGVGVTRLDRSVISIGNLSTGGTGKTPLVQHVVRTLIVQGHHPAIAMRGYKAKPGQMSDEQREHASVFPDVPIVAQPDRASGLQELFEREHGQSVDVVVLDDGFQHRKIARDLDVVLIDASRAPSGDALLPLGHLREGVDSLCRADVVVITHAELIEQDELGALRQFILKHVNGETVIAVTEHRWESVEQNFHEQQKRSEPITCLSGMRVAVLTGIGHPEAFVSMADDAGAVVVHRCDRPDHEPFSEALLERFWGDAQQAGAEAVLMTSKDWCRVDMAGNEADLTCVLPVYIPQLGVQFRSGQSEFDQACADVRVSR